MTEFKYANAPKNPRWFECENGFEICESYSINDGFFMALRNKLTGEIMKEDFYASDYGRRKACIRFMNKFECAK